MLTLTEIFKQLGDVIRVPDLKLNEQGVCALTLDNRLQIILEPSPQPDKLLLYSFMCPLPEKNSETLYKHLMEAHSFGVGTDCGVFGAAEKLGCVYFFKVFDLNIITFDHFMKSLETFVQAFDFWQKKIEEWGFPVIKIEAPKA